MDHHLEGKIVVITGAGRGLGQAIAQSLGEHGAHVIVADMRHELATNTAGKLRDQGFKATAVQLDVTDEDSVGEVMNMTREEFGRVDALVNNAGTDLTVPIEEMSFEDWDRIIATNLRGPFAMSKHALSMMKARGEGHIINIVSTAAKRAWANASAYHASKWGLLGFSHALHVEARPHNVKVTAVICGGMRTPFLLDRFPDIDLNNLQDPKDVADTIRFLLLAPKGTVIPEMMAIPMRETSWP